MNDNEIEKTEDFGGFENMQAEEIDHRLRTLADQVVQPSLLEGNHEGAWARTIPRVYAELHRLANDALSSPSIHTKRLNAAECRAILAALVSYDEGRQLRSLAIKFAHRRQQQLIESPPESREESAEIVSLER